MVSLVDNSVTSIQDGFTNVVQTLDVVVTSVGGDEIIVNQRPPEETEIHTNDAQTIDKIIDKQGVIVIDNSAPLQTFLDGTVSSNNGVFTEVVENKIKKLEALNSQTNQQKTSSSWWWLLLIPVGIYILKKLKFF